MKILNLKCHECDRVGVELFHVDRQMRNCKTRLVRGICVS